MISFPNLILIICSDKDYLWFLLLNLYLATLLKCLNNINSLCLYSFGFPTYTVVLSEINHYFPFYSSHIVFLSSLHVPVGRPSGFREHPGFVLSLKGNAFNNYAFLVLPSGLRDLSSPSGDQTRATCSGRRPAAKPLVGRHSLPC